MAITLMDNQFPGINPLLNSRLQQAKGGWRSFHTSYLEQIKIALNRVLPAHYFAEAEDGLQVNAIEGGWATAPQSMIGDVVISRTQPGEATQGAQSIQPIMQFEHAPAIEEPPLGLVIYEAVGTTGDGQPVTRLELLSAANLPGGSGHVQYVQRRDYTVRSGLHLVELDFLHTRPPLFRWVPDYRAQQENAYPYYVFITHSDQQITEVYGIAALDPLPTLAIPLTQDDTVALDLAAPYQQSFASTPRYWRLIADYSQDPVEMERYTDADQQQIRERLAEIRAAHAES